VAFSRVAHGLRLGPICDDVCLFGPRALVMCSRCFSQVASLLRQLHMVHCHTAELERQSSAEQASAVDRRQALQVGSHCTLGKLVRANWSQTLG
jgi:hypothetical protein